MTCIFKKIISQQRILIFDRTTNLQFRKMQNEILIDYNTVPCTVEQLSLMKVHKQ